MGWKATLPKRSVWPSRVRTTDPVGGRVATKMGLDDHVGKGRTNQHSNPAYSVESALTHMATKG